MPASAARRLRLTGLVAAAVAALAGLPASATAAPRWLAPHDSAHPPDPTTGATSATSDTGTTAFAYRTASGSVVVHGRRPGEPAADQVLATTAMTDAGPPHVAVDNGGDAIVVFDAVVAGGRRVYAAYRGRGDAEWGAAEPVFPGEARSAAVALDGAGDALIAGEAATPGGPAVHARYRAADGSYGDDDALEVAGGDGALGSAPAVAFDAAGRAVLAFRRDGGAGPDTLFRALRPAGTASTFGPAAAFVAPADPDAAPDTDGLRVLTGASGDATIAWAGRDGDAVTIRAVHEDALGLWGAVATVAADPLGFTSWDVDADDAGDAVLLAAGRNGLVARRYDDVLGAWAADGSLPRGLGAPEELDLDLNGPGAAVALATEPGGDAVALERPAAGGWGTPVVVDAGGAPSATRHPEVGLDDQGDVHATWQRPADPGGAAVQRTRVRDAAAPAERAITVPAVIEAGTAATMTATFSDRASGVTVDWDFGDGGQDTGGTVAHAYATPGDRTVTVTATDEAGNQTSATRRTTVQDTVAPQLTVTARPDELTSDEPVTFAFSATDASGLAPTVVCTVDGETAPCTSPLELRELPDGEHTVAIRASDGTNVSASDETTFSVDHTAPAVEVTAAPGRTNAAEPAVEFASGDAGLAGFRCSLDGAALADCASPARLPGLEDGQHTFEVVALDAAGNESAPAFAPVDVDRTGPTARILVGPNSRTNQQPVRFWLAGDAETDALSCTFDGVPIACGRELVLPGIPDGEHTLTIRADDDLGNRGPVVSRTFVADRAAPVVGLTSPADGAETTSPTITLAGTASRAPGDEVTVDAGIMDAGATRELDAGEAAVGADGRWSFTPAVARLEPGRYVAFACQYDTATNYDCRTARFTVRAPASTTPVPPAGGRPDPGPPAPAPDPSGQAARQGLARTTADLAGALARLGLGALTAARGRPVAFGAPVPGRLRVRLVTTPRTGGTAVLVASATGTATEAGRLAVRVRPTPAGRALARRAIALRLTLRATFTPRTGRAQTSTRRLTVRRRPG